MSITKKAFSWASNPTNSWVGIAVRAIVVMFMLPLLLGFDFLRCLPSMMVAGVTTSPYSDDDDYFFDGTSKTHLNEHYLVD